MYLSGEIFDSFQFCDFELPRGQIQQCHSVFGRALGDADKIVVTLVPQQRLFKNRPGRDDARDLPLDDPLGKPRVLHLVADGHFVPRRNQARHIGLRRVERHSAHGGLARRACVAGRQGDVEYFGGLLGILKKHFIKIPQAEKENRLRKRLLDAPVLRHHGCQSLCHKWGRFLFIY